MNTTNAVAIGTSEHKALRALRLKCVRCDRELDIASEQVSCATCGRAWPVRGDVARIFEPSYYWGEMPQADATSFLREAEEDGWRDAVRRRFAGDSDMLISVLDTQRTSWVPLLGLRDHTVALDIGSGYGALTHALARQVAEVYSVEAIPERIDFTRVRLAQEGISNVHLIQASALELPLLDESFDLIVSNGVLEWVGEWTTDGDPRDVQLRFLSHLHRLLKPGGLLVIGIENRIGFATLAGERDHSGLPYTSLMPRWLASLRLRHARGPHHRTTLNSKRRYRTYTYSEHGYRRLLARSGFEPAWFYGADAGYNQPHTLFPVREWFVRDYVRASLDDPAAASHANWRRLAKRLAASLAVLRPFVSEFVIVAAKPPAGGRAPGDRLTAALQAALPQLPRVHQPVCSLSTAPFSKKTLVRVFESGASAPTLFVKTSTPAHGSKQAVAAEFKHLSLLHARLKGPRTPRWAVPRPIGRCTLGRLDCAVESAAPGRELTGILREHVRQGRADLIQRELERCVGVATDLTQMMHGERSVSVVDPQWWTLPQELALAPVDRAVANDVLSLATGARDYQDYVQHGDFTIENVFLDPSTGMIAVIDWEHTLRGVPPLYDCFALLISLLPVIATRKPAASSSAVEAQFLDAFFHGGPASELVRHLLVTACNRLSIRPERVWTMLGQCLVVRTHYFASRSSPAAELSRSLLELTCQRRHEFALPAASP